MTWLDEMKTPENVDELAGLIVGLVHYYGQTFCIDYKILIKEFPFMDNEESINSLAKTLRINSVFITKIKDVSTFSELEEIGRDKLLVKVLRL